MNYLGLFTPYHLAVLQDWITESGELFVDLNYPHSGGSGRDYFVRSLEDLHRLISQQTNPEIEISIFRRIIFPIRGSDHQAILQQALQDIPVDQYYQIVTPEVYPLEYEQLADGKGHADLMHDISGLEPGRSVAVGVHPFDISGQEFGQLYGDARERLFYSVHKNLNWYEEFDKNPAKYQKAIEAWSTKS